MAGEQQGEESAALKVSENSGGGTLPAPPAHKRLCWICGEADLVVNLPIVCDESACPGRRAHRDCLEEWIAMMDGNPVSKLCAACNQQYREVG